MMVSKRWIYLLMLGVSALGCNERPNTEPAKLEITASTDQQAFMSGALKALYGQCLAFTQGGQDLKQGTAYIRTGDISWSRDYGWDKMVEVEVVIADPPTVLPRSTGSGYSGGHHCYYQIGSGDEPGITTSKSVCKEICGWDDETDFIPASTFKTKTPR